MLTAAKIALYTIILFATIYSYNYDYADLWPLS